MKPLFLLLLFVCNSCLWAQQDVLSPELLWKFSRLGDVKISSDKNIILYQVKSYQLENNSGNSVIYKINSNGTRLKQLTESGMNAFNPRFTPDKKRIGFLSSKSGDVQLWEMDTAGKNMRQVTSIEGGIGGFLYSPDGKKLLFYKEVKIGKTTQDLYPDLPYAKAKIIDGLMYRHWDHWEDEYCSHLFYVNYNEGIIMGEPVDILKDQPFDSPLSPFGGDEQLGWTQDGKSIIYTCIKLSGTEAAYSTNSDIFKYDIATGVTTNLTDRFPGYDQDPQMSIKGNKLYWLSMEKPGYESDKNRLMCYDMDLKNRYEVLDKLDRTVESYTQSTDGKYIYAIVVHEGTKQIVRVTLSNMKYEFITTGDYDYTFCEALDAGRQLVIRQSMTQAPELYILKNKKTDALTHLNDKIYTQLKTGKIERRMVKTSDGKEMLCWVAYPPDFDKSKKYPALLYCQGGPQSPVSQFFSYRWNFQLMAAQGYIVIAPNRRGLQGFGKEWNDQIVGDYGGQCMTDLLSAIDDLANEKYIDTGRLGCVGASFGGYSVYWLAGHHKKRFKAFIAHCGMYNMESWYGTTEEMFFAKNDQKGSYWDNKENFQRFSPHHFVKYWDAPILIIHNEKDFRVPLGQGMEAFTAAQSLNIPSRFLYFQDENHWVTKPQNSVLWQREFFRWLNTYLKSE